MIRRRSLLLSALPAWKCLASVLQPDVRCLTEASQSYALYVPSTYKSDREWPLLLCFDPRARGAEAAERFVAAAEDFGWIVAASNNSRNGPWEVSNQALLAMGKDLLDRFAIDKKRLYTAGMSGGARVAMQVALSGGAVSGVIAASAGFPDSQPRKNLAFPVFASAGTEDFNWLEMKQLERGLKSPHRLRVFPGGHVWLPASLAREGIEFLELSAMRSGLRSAAPALVAKLSTARVAAAENLSGLPAFEAWRAISEDFAGLVEISTRAATISARLEKDKEIKAALRAENKEMELELETRQDFLALEAAIANPSQRVSALEQLDKRLQKLGIDAKADLDSAPRRVARRVGRGLSSVTTDPIYLKMLEAAGFARRAAPPLAPKN